VGGDRVPGDRPFGPRLFFALRVFFAFGLDFFVFLAAFPQLCFATFFADLLGHFVCLLHRRGGFRRFLRRAAPAQRGGREQGGEQPEGAAEGSCRHGFSSVPARLGLRVRGDVGARRAPLRPGRGGPFGSVSGVPLDRSILGKLASEQMEALEEDYGDEEGVEMGAVMTFVEVITPMGEPDEQGNVPVKSSIRMRHNVRDPYRVVGLLAQAQHDILANE
jgi:hypothetical protein